MTKKTEEKQEQPPVVISGNVLYGVHWDAKATEAVNTVAKALLNITELFKSQNIHIDGMIKVNESITMGVNKFEDKK